MIRPEKKRSGGPPKYLRNFHWLLIFGLMKNQNTNGGTTFLPPGFAHTAEPDFLSQED